MKLPTSLFLAAIIWLIACYFGRAHFTHEDLVKRGVNSEIAQQEIKELTMLTVAETPAIERKIDLNYFESIYVNKGFKLVHDPSLGQASYLVGPAEILDKVIYKDFIQNARVRLKFSTAVELKEPVVLRTNLNEHNVGELSLAFQYQEGEDIIENFKTLGPIEAQNLKIGEYLIANQPIDLSVKSISLPLNRCSDCIIKKPLKLAGKATTVNLPDRLDNLDFSQLSAEKHIINYRFMAGRKLNLESISSLDISYTSRLAIGENDQKFQPIPDTLIVSKGTQINAIVFEEGMKQSFEELVIIEKE